MKHTVLKTASVLALATLSTQAFAEPKLSGVAVISANYGQTDTKTTTNGVTTTTSNKNKASLKSTARVRISGTQKMTDDIDAEYSMEYNVGLSNDNLVGKVNNNFSSRDSYIGLKNKELGTVRFGRLLTPDTNIDIANAYYFSPSSAISYAAQRTNNSIQYLSPKFNDNKTSVKVHYALDQDPDIYKEGTNNHGGLVKLYIDGKQTDVRREIAVASITHEDDLYEMGAAYTSGGKFSAVGAMAKYKPTKAFTLGVQAQHTNFNSKDNELGVLGSAVYSLDDTLDLYAEASRASNYEGVKGVNYTAANTGFIKKFGKVETFANAGYTNQASDSNGTKSSETGYVAELGISIPF